MSVLSAESTVDLLHVPLDSGTAKFVFSASHFSIESFDCSSLSDSAEEMSAWKGLVSWGFDGDVKGISMMLESH